MNILIVDDDTNLVRVTVVALQSLGHRAFIAASFAAANEVLKTKKIDAVLLDLNLNGENGFPFLSELVAKAIQAPVILFTAQSRDEVEEEAKRRGAFDCLVKPFTMEDLRQQLAQIERFHRLKADSEV